ncbi:site-specific DNA-methyltransferase [bacterium]|nr:site-specific DNA-methyltransferase [bacterium]
MYEVQMRDIARKFTDQGDFRALVRADCRNVLPRCPADSAALVHTSPPYNIGRRYRGSSDAREIEQYRSFLREVILELSRVVKPGGSIFWQTGYTESRHQRPATGNDGILLLDSLSLPTFSDCGFVLWDRIVWNYFGSMAFKSKFTNRHETILWFVKAGPNCSKPLFQLDEVREKAVSYDGRNHVLGRNPGNVWQAERVAYGSTGQTTHPAVFPEEISEKIIRCCSKPGDVVVDPFAGSGTACKVSLTLGRQFLGCDISEGYIREANERLGLWANGEIGNLALGLLIEYAFRRKPGGKTIGELDAFLSVACRGDFVGEVTELDKVVRELAAPERVTSQVKRRKQEVWKKHDALIRFGNGSKAVVAADRALCFCFAHRKRWNGLRRYLSAGLLLKELREQFLGREERDRADTVRQLCLHAPTRFHVSSNRVELKRVDPGLGCNIAGVENASPDQLQQALF